MSLRIDAYAVDLPRFTAFLEHDAGRSASQVSAWWKESRRTTYVHQWPHPRYVLRKSGRFNWCLGRVLRL